MADHEVVVDGNTQAACSGLNAGRDLDVIGSHLFPHPDDSGIRLMSALGQNAKVSERAKLVRKSAISGHVNVRVL
jgi:hypothetical protein